LIFKGLWRAQISDTQGSNDHRKSLNPDTWQLRQFPTDSRPDCTKIECRASICIVAICARQLGGWRTKAIGRWCASRSRKAPPAKPNNGRVGNDVRRPERLPNLAARFAYSRIGEPRPSINRSEQLIGGDCAASARKAGADCCAKIATTRQVGAHVDDAWAAAHSGMSVYKQLGRDVIRRFIE
jgi:hypothetical protein